MKRRISLVDSLDVDTSLGHNDKTAEYRHRNQEWIADLKRTYRRAGDSNLDGTIRRLGEKDYFRQYYESNLDKKSEYRNAHAASSVAYARQHYLRNKDKKVEYQNRSSDEHNDYVSMKERRRDYERRYNLRNNERNAEYSSRLGVTKARYQGEYKTQNKEKVAEWKKECYLRDGSLRSKNRRVGRKESDRSYFRSYFGTQRTFRSWKTPELVRDYFDSIASRLNISTYEDWYRISRKQVAQNGGESLYITFGSLGAALHTAFPEINWNFDAFSQRSKKSGQRWLILNLKELLPGVNVVEDYLHPDLKWVGDSDQNMELDLWIPQHRIGIEYQGQQHYYNIDSFGPSSGTGAYSERDTLKNSLCESRGITLIAIPYWWDGSIESLSATLYQARPDVFPVSHGRPIPREMPVLSRGNRGHQSDSAALKYIE